MADNEDALRAMQNCFHSQFSVDEAEYEDIEENRRTSVDEDSIYLGCTLSQSFNPDFHHSPVIKMGWLHKTPPQGTLVFQKRWVMLDAQYLRYFQNEKEVYSKRIIAILSVTKVLNVGGQKFEVVTRNRTFLFRAENNTVREEWVSVLKETIQQHCNSMEKSLMNSSDTRGQRASRVSLISKQGYLEMSGLRSKLYVVICADSVFLYRNAEEHSQGVGITSIEMNLGTVKGTDKRSFNLTTIYRTFSFVAESEQQREQWVEVLQACVSHSLSSNAVAQKIWSEEANQRCADCGAPHPDWASVNLCVVLCKCCAGVHRGLGQSVSKVRSLKMDENAWTENQLFLLLGNDKVNLFWAANIPPSEMLCPSSDSEERQRFVTAKYCQGKYRCYHALFGQQEALNKALCNTIQTGDVLETLSLVFCGADVNCYTGDPELPSPVSVAQHYGQTLQVEFLTHNHNTELPGSRAGDHTILEAALPISHTGYLFKTASSTRAVTERKSKGDFSRRWCSLNQGNFSYYESEKSSSQSGQMKMSDVLCLVVNPQGKHGYGHSFELYHDSGRVYLFGEDSPDTVREWIKVIGKALVPPVAEDLVGWSFERVGRLRYTVGQSFHCPCLGWFSLGGSRLLLLLHGEDQVDNIDLRKLQELSVEQEAGAVVLVDRGRRLRLEGDRRPDYQGWLSGIQQGLGRGDGPLDQQQLTETEVPVIVDRCISYITQHGLKSEGIYRRCGVNSKIAALLLSLRHDARQVRLSEGVCQVDNVANVLKRFLREVGEGVFNGHQASLPWLHTTTVSERRERVSQYKALLHSLPPVNRATLGAVINHLYCVQCFADENQMNMHNLAIVFGPTLFQTDGTDNSAGQVVEELIQNYQDIFNVNAEQLQRQLDMISHVIKAQEEHAEEGTPSPLTICGIYLERKEEGSELLVQISQAVSAEELVCEVLRRGNIPPQQGDYWSCFLVNDNQEMERPLHYQERALAIYFSLGKDCHLVVKRNCYMEAMLIYIAAMVDVSRNSMIKFSDEKGQRGKRTFSRRLCVLDGTSLRLYKEVKSTQPERECQVHALKVYYGIKKRLQPPSCWGMTVVCEQAERDKQQWYLCCESKNELIKWLATFMNLQHNSDLCPAASRPDS
ncbi:arf-GAP with Rho-GAP domain, ANK repeat and PH domain-containing protein 1 [Oncorhynchus kisutch]|uniref:arf-GAP with Rho-GAP domain, ANK repeat and PH domain-containing protein 1 n=1 Tax=Oncorhynchus kisutch TaxID=8019 RepID=UPI0009A01A22|nr:arf-GAP with Rho-GAP domain, ANK repeat and PH domain-containing protein 1 [Oncorhynchus kisutch]XP_031663598.1 arf-GAP with Rho-GAP domain, ANK repeat and PH domain-containing protein 1 [Oncorhynchus kisutch]